MVQIYSPHTSERLNYILRYVFEERLGIPYKLVNSIETIDSAQDLLINYSEEIVPGSLQIIPQGILFEHGVKYLVFDLTEQEDASILLQKPENRLYFDIFSAIFYLLSRYEEYLMFAKDQHHRFKYEDSCLYQGNCLNVPLVDSWLMNFRNLLVTEFGLEANRFRQDKFSVQPSIDIDSVYAYKGRPMFRHLAALLRNLVFLQFGEIGKRLAVLWFGRPDPNDNFEFQLSELRERGLKATYFFQVGSYGHYDKNIDPSNKGFIDIIKKVKAAGHTVGLHPSYQSNSEIELISAEKKILESITGEPVLQSRQHFLRFELPRTYRNLLACGIREEHSMGYSELNGFRAGTAFPFYWFDLEHNKATDLRIVPFSAMDVAYKQHGAVNKDEAIRQSRELVQVIQAADAPFRFVFHNESLSEHRGWQGWREVFKSWLDG